MDYSAAAETSREETVCKHLVIDVPVLKFISEMIYRAVDTFINFPQQFARSRICGIAQGRKPVWEFRVLLFPEEAMAPHFDSVAVAPVIYIVSVCISYDVACSLIGAPFSVVFANRPIEMAENEVLIGIV